MHYYDPLLEWCTRQDLVGGSLYDLNSGNRYTYVEDDPVNLVDPSGRFNLTLGCISTIVGLGYSLITAFQGLIAAAQGWLGLAAFAAALSTGPAGWIIYVVTIGVSFLITAALGLGFYEGGCSVRITSCPISVVQISEQWDCAVYKHTTATLPLQLELYNETHRLISRQTMTLDAIPSVTKEIE